jgi:hypothetical protein
MTSDSDTLPTLYDAGRALLNRRVYTDAEVYDDEIRLIFERSWLAIGHESLVPEPGDFFLSKMGHVPVLLWRGLEGRLRVFFNACGMSNRLLCFAEQGNAEDLECRCHGVRYRFDGAAIEREAHLVPVERVEDHLGLLFATFAEDGPELEDHLGDFAFYLDGVLSVQAGPPVRFLGPIKNIVGANWKLPMDAFMGGLHVEKAAGADGLRDEGLFLKVSAGPGAALVRDNAPGFEVVRGALFPNLAFSRGERGLHLFQPRGPRETEVWSFFLGGGNESESELLAARARFVNGFSPTSPAFEDMAANWREITRLSSSRAARRRAARFDAGLGEERFHEELPGLVAEAANEMNQRGFYQMWHAALDAK